MQTQLDLFTLARTSAVQQVGNLEEFLDLFVLTVWARIVIVYIILLFKADGDRREAPIGDSLFMRAAGAVVPKYAQTPQNWTHTVNDRKFDHQSQ
jgi:hypothetical protein